MPLHGYRRIVVIGAQRPAQPTDDLIHHRGELRAAVVDHGTARGADHASGERGRTGNAELWFTHAPKSTEGRVRDRPPHGLVPAAAAHGLSRLDATAEEHLRLDQAAIAHGDVLGVAVALARRQLILVQQKDVVLA